MLNSTQKNFRKQMEDARREGKVPESYGPRFSGVEIFKTHKVGFSIGGLSLVAVTIFCWNLFSLGTWINAVFHVNIFPATSTLGSKNKQEIIHEYIQKNDDTNKYIASSMEMVSNYFSRVKSYSPDTIKSQHTTLLTFKTNIETDESMLKPLKEAYMEEFQVCEEILAFAEDNYNRRLTQNDVNYINILFQQGKNISLKRRNILGEIFKQAHMAYNMEPDGTIRYQYKKTSFGY